MKVFIAHPANFDYVHELYEPVKQSALWGQHEIILPYDSGKGVKTKSIIEQSDILIAEVSRPSTGTGIELGWADAAGIKIAAIYHTGAKHSNSIKFLTQDLEEYSGADELIEIIGALIRRAAP